MNRHAGPPRPSEAPPVAEPTHAERARTLVHLGRTGSLATLSRKHPGHPFASVMPYGVDTDGRPLLLVSSMAMHTQNLQADRRASLLVSQPGWTGDPLAAGRVTLMGDASVVAAPEVASVRAAYLARHAEAASWADFGDFSFWRLNLTDVYFVGGFAAMGWVTVEEYQAAAPDPLAESAAGIIDHMNSDHADALVTYARVLASAEADEARMTGVDRLGFRLRLRAGDRHYSLRIPFPRAVATAADARKVFIEMLRDARIR